MVMGVILWLLNHISESVQRDVIHEFISIGAEMDLSLLHILQILRSTLFNGFDESTPTWVRGLEVAFCRISNARLRSCFHVD